MTETTAEPAAEPEADQIAALSRIASVTQELIVSLARDRIERADLIDALGRIANDAEACLSRLGVTPF